MDDASVAFYDGLAADYHLVYGDRWEDAVAHQAAALDDLVGSLCPAPGPRRILDCTCGIGTQAIGLALRGHDVLGSDISEVSLVRARREAERLGARVAFARADMRDLSEIAGEFDVVLSCDNAFAHLPSDEDVVRALAAMRARLRAAGLIVVSVRDYARVLRERPPPPPPLVVPGPPRRVLVRLQDWDGPDARWHTVRFLVLTEGDDGEWSVAHHHGRLRAITRAELTSCAARAGLGAVAWHEADAVGFHQPVMTASASDAPAGARVRRLPPGAPAPGATPRPPGRCRWAPYVAI